MKDACCVREKIAKVRKNSGKKTFQICKNFPRMIDSYSEYNCTTMNSIATHCYMHRHENCQPS